MTTTSWYPSATVVAALLFAGCAVGPDYQRPAVKVPAAFRDQTASGAAALADTAWWDVYRDDRLKELVRAALIEGFDVRIAAARVEQSRAVAAEVHGRLFPAVGYAANADRGRNAQLGNAFTQGGGNTVNGFDGYLAAAWELDVWGHVRRLDEAARAQFLASEDARRGVLLSLVSDVATNYFDLLALDEELAIARRATESFDESLKLFNRRVEGGVGSRLETASAEAAMAQNAARVPDIERQIAIKENQISILLGRAPGAIVRGARLTDLAAPPEVPPGLPSALLERRPDVRQAEDAARAANAGIGITKGSFLPRIGLSALLGAVSPRLEDITSSRAGLWSVGTQITGPVFQAGGLRGQYREAEEIWQEARLRYERTALNAFGEVANALVTRQKLAEMRTQQEHAVRAYDDALKVSTERYTAGKAAYFEVLQVQQQLYPAEVALAHTRRDELEAFVQLYKALGGGWNLSDEEWIRGASK